ncbi:uncharacterized protein SPAPADRAFT_154964 [Spathaspora passalidarum NRRL Y-27907]|uniref:TECPR1-like DysF domain-containing protein n=1 Tax=Spathaspora passalidarum (strain NRRL Y-27907 / 11-Y1) TaxID=619300 RepID=G3AQP0_SPAPN|nr:uncharacterized protein SPAPADRAFT_154964 [Spathaspora passalidarum NRRL Y-27907]EGW31587.1 hypothetical protein SPAPADRAFT_154964 [Spathaspora passalidarum NRRL Y-27907]
MDKPSYRERALGVLSQAIEKSNTIAQSNPGTKRAIAAGTASILLEMGLESYDKQEEPILTSDQISQIESIAESAQEQPKSKHFADRLIEKLIQTSLPENVPDRDKYEARLKESKQPGMSIAILTSNMRKLLVKMSIFFHVYYGGIHVLTWKRPAKTLSVLVLYTAVCIWPHLVLVYPLIFVLFGVFIPGYVHRHPMRRPDLIKVKRRGQSLWNYFFDTDEISVLEEFMDEQEYFNESPATPDSDELSDEMSVVTEITTPDDETIETRKSQLDIVMNLRDLQGLTTDLLVGIEKGEQFYSDIGGFKDERLSTFIFYGTVLATGIVMFLGQFIPWRLIFIQSGWAVMLLLHPKAKKLLVNAQKLQKPKDEVKTEVEPAVKEDKPFDRNDIIVDDSPEVRMVEVFELQMKSILKSEWKFYRYTNTLYDKSNKSRVAGKRPRGVDDLSKVLPPHDWKFDFGLVNKWKVDEEPVKFLTERSYDIKLFKLKNDEWIYDDMENVEQDIVYEFRRRRLSRDCFRYGRAK